MMMQPCVICGRPYRQRRGKAQFSPACSRRCDAVYEEEAREDKTEGTSQGALDPTSEVMGAALEP